MSANRFQTWLAKKQGRAALGVTTGFVNSLFGSGGGMLVVPALAHSGLDQRKAQATALAAILPISAFSAVGYFTQTSVPWDVTLFSALGALPGGLIGAWLLGKLPQVWLTRIFSVLMIVAGWRMMMG